MPLHPQAKQFLADAAARRAPGWDQLSPEEGRKLFAQWVGSLGPGPAVGRVEDRTLADVPVRVYTPEGDGPFGVTLYFHGGGWVLGDLDTHDALCRQLTQASASVFVAVDYRRAPEHKYPAALEDCYAATWHAAQHAEQLGGSGKLAVAGDSAGGGLAASVSLWARDRGGPRIDLQLLVYPITDHNLETGSYREFAEGFGLTRAAMAAFWNWYLESADDGSQPAASPLRAPDLSGLPPAHVITAEYDVLRDEGEAYAARLTEAGVAATCRRYDGMPHGFFHLNPLFDDGQQAIRDVGQILRRALG